VRIEDVDQNLKIESDITEPDIVWMDIKNAPFSIHGIFYDEDSGK